MNIKMREMQLKLLKIFSRCPKSFALAGGTALELYYLKHRFSKDLDFFSVVYEKKEIKTILESFEKETGIKIKPENTVKEPGKAMMEVYKMPVEGTGYDLKIDFIEEVIIEKPVIRKFETVPVYDISDIYRQKITAITGVRLEKDYLGAFNVTGRGAARDAVDIYYISKKLKPLHSFLKMIPIEQQKGMARWINTISRMDFKLEMLDLDIYDKNLDSGEVIAELEKEIQMFVDGEIK